MAKLPLAEVGPAGKGEVETSIENICYFTHYQGCLHASLWNIIIFKKFATKEHQKDCG